MIDPHSCRQPRRGLADVAICGERDIAAVRSPATSGRLSGSRGCLNEWSSLTAPLDFCAKSDKRVRRPLAQEGCFVSVAAAPTTERD
jgi:hypothetical protein